MSEATVWCSNCDHQVSAHERFGCTLVGCECMFEHRDANGPSSQPVRGGQVGGEHYRSRKIQPWDVIDEYDLDFYSGSALKYLLRAGSKGSRLEDLRKCRHVLDKMIELEKGS